MSFPHDQYLYIGGVMRSVSLAVGAVVLLEIMWDFRQYGPRLLPWIGSLLATFVTLTTWGRGILLTNARASLGDAVFPTLIGIVEFSLFVVLSPRLRSRAAAVTERLHKFHDWNAWFFFSAIHALLGVLIVQTRLSNTDPNKDFDSALRPLALEYTQWMHDDRLGATIGTIIFLVSGLLMAVVLRRWKTHLWYNVIYVLLTVIPIAVFLQVICNAESQRHRTEEFVFRATQANH